MMDGKATKRRAVIWCLFISLIGFVVGIIAMIFSRPVESPDLPDLAISPSNEVEMVDASAWDAILEPGFQIDDSERRMLTSEVRVSCMKCRKPIPADENACRFCGARFFGSYDFDADSIPDQAEKDVGMDLANPDDAFEDMDGDGFSNYMEFDQYNFKWYSDPKDAASFPPEIVKLRMVKYRETPEGIINGPVPVDVDKKTLLVKVGGNRETWTVRLGDVFDVGGVMYKVISLDRYECLVQQVDAEMRWSIRAISHREKKVLADLLGTNERGLAE